MFADDQLYHINHKRLAVRLNLAPWRPFLYPNGIATMLDFALIA
jgi:hypothetical protein